MYVCMYVCIFIYLYVSSHILNLLPSSAILIATQSLAGKSDFSKRQGTANIVNRPMSRAAFLRSHVPRR